MVEKQKSYSKAKNVQKTQKFIKYFNRNLENTTEHDRERLLTSFEWKFLQKYLQLTVIVDKFSDYFQNFY